MEHQTISLDAWHVPVTFGQSLRSVEFAVWSEEGWQDDLVWYAGTAFNDRFKAHAPFSNHGSTGKYYVDVYAHYSNGTMDYVGGTTFFIQKPSADDVAIVNRNEKDGTFQVEVSGVRSGMGIANVQVPVWSQSDQSDIVWYSATRQSDGIYIAYVDIKNHKNNLGKYIAHVYVRDMAGLFTYVGQASTPIVNADNAYFNIVGSSAVTAQQLEAYYSANEQYPKFYANTDAPDLATFCRMYIEECNAEGIKAEVAFCQAMKETGFLRYLGDVSIEQLNFAGLDAAGKQDDGTIVRGRSYTSVREGVRAHIQRLKAYALKGTTPDSFAHPCIDADKYTQWWVNTIVGSAPYVEWLGKSQNPSGFGWATDPNYGYSIRNDYIAKLLQY